jgi:hypothetical protein
VQPRSQQFKLSSPRCDGISRAEYWTKLERGGIGCRVVQVIPAEEVVGIFLVIMCRIARRYFGLSAGHTASLSSHPRSKFLLKKRSTRTTAITSQARNDIPTRLMSNYITSGRPFLDSLDFPKPFPEVTPPRPVRSILGVLSPLRLVNPCSDRDGALPLLSDFSSGPPKSRFESSECLLIALWESGESDSSKLPGRWSFVE